MFKFRVWGMVSEQCQVLNATPILCVVTGWVLRAVQARQLQSTARHSLYACGGNPCAELQDVHGLSEGSVFRKAAQLMVAS